MLQTQGNGTYWFSDEMYRLLEHNSPPLPAVAASYERGVTLSGMSKTYSMPGLRIGWLATTDRVVMNRLNELKDYTTICPSAPSEILALIGLRNGDEIVSRNQALMRDGLVAARSFCERHDDIFVWANPKGGSICFPRLRGGVSSTEVCASLAKEGIMLVHSELFEDAGNERVRFGVARADFPQNLALLEPHLVRFKTN